MAVFNEINDRGQLSQLLQRRLDMGGTAPAPSLMPEVGPTLCLENDRPEWSWLKSERLRSRTVELGAVAGQRNHVQLYLPPTAQAVAVVTEIILWSNVAAWVARVAANAGIAGWAVEQVVARDFRDTSTGGDVIFQRVTSATAVGSPQFISYLQDIGQRFTQPIVLAPRGLAASTSALIIYNYLVNEPLVVTVNWYERPALPGELA